MVNKVNFIFPWFTAYNIPFFRFTIFTIMLNWNAMYDFSRYANYLQIECLTILLQYVHETKWVYNKLHEYLLLPNVGIKQILSFHVEKMVLMIVLFSIKVYLYQWTSGFFSPEEIKKRIINVKIRSVAVRSKNFSASKVSVDVWNKSSNL